MYLYIVLRTVEYIIMINILSTQKKRRKKQESILQRLETTYYKHYKQPIMTK